MTPDETTPGPTRAHAPATAAGIRWPDRSPKPEFPQPAPAPNGGAAQLLVVCTANICRSRMAETLLAHRFAGLPGSDRGAIVVHSAGVLARPGVPMAPLAAQVLTGRGHEASDGLSRQVTGQDVAAADLVLTASREHRTAVVGLTPSASGRTFTLREFAWLLSADQPTREPAAASAAASGTAADASAADRLRALVRLAAGRRGLRQPASPDDLDIADPYGGPLSGYTRTLTLLEGIVEVLGQQLA